MSKIKTALEKSAISFIIEGKYRYAAKVCCMLEEGTIEEFENILEDTEGENK